MSIKARSSKRLSHLVMIGDKINDILYRTISSNGSDASLYELSLPSYSANQSVTTTRSKSLQNLRNHQHFGFALIDSSNMLWHLLLKKCHLSIFIGDIGQHKACHTIKTMTVLFLSLLNVLVKGEDKNEVSPCALWWHTVTNDGQLNCTVSACCNRSTSKELLLQGIKSV